MRIDEARDDEIAGGVIDALCEHILARDVVDDALGDLDVHHPEGSIDIGFRILYSDIHPFTSRGSWHFRVHSVL